jgi:Holliday junction resolvase-like predicted endonuclease
MSGGSHSRNKGKVGEREARDVLTERGFDILADTTDGQACCDLIVQKGAHVYFVEVKNRASIDLCATEKQARRQAGKRRWLCMCRLAGYPLTFLVTGTDQLPVIWRGNAAKSG